MSLRPIDMQIMVQKAPDVAKPVIEESQYYSAIQQNVAEKFTKESLMNEKRVPVIEKTESEKVDEDGHGGAGEQRDKRRRRRERREDSDNQNEVAQPENSFDISI